MTTGRRRFLKGAGLAAAAAGVPLTAQPAPPAEAADLDALFGRGRYQWLPGDHHTHSQYSYDAMYRIDQIAAGGRAHGANWIVFTDHGHAEHEKASVKPTRRTSPPRGGATPT